MSTSQAGDLGRAIPLLQQNLTDTERLLGPAHLDQHTATAAWVADAVIAFNNVRAAAVAADQHRARWATLRTRDHQCARPDRVHRPAPDAASAYAMALDQRLGVVVVDRDRPTSRLRDLTTSRRRRYRGPKWKSRHRPADQPRPGHPLHTHPTLMRRNH